MFPNCRRTLLRCRVSRGDFLEADGPSVSGLWREWPRQDLAAEGQVYRFRGLGVVLFFRGVHREHRGPWRVAQYRGGPAVWDQRPSSAVEGASIVSPAHRGEYPR